ncbi:ATP-binding protein [Emticicia sediminis]
MKRLLLFLLLLISNLIFAQQQRKLDSLKAVLAKLPAEGRSFATDTMRVNLLCEMGSNLMNSDTSLYFFNKSLEIAERVNWLKGQATSLNFLSRRVRKSGNLFKSNGLAFRALAIAEKSNLSSQIAFGLRNIADVYSLSDKLDSSIIYYEKAINIYTKLNDKNGILTCFNNMGVLFRTQKKYEQSLKYFDKVIEKNRDFKIRRFDAYALNNKAITYREIRKYSLAIENLSKAISVYLALGASNEDLAIAKLEFLHIYYELKEYDKVIKQSQNVIDINNKATVRLDMEVYKILFNVYKKLGNTQKSLHYFEKYFEIYESTSKEDFESKLKSSRFEYDLEKQKERVELQKKDIANRNTIQWFLVCGIFIFLIFLLLQLRSNKILKKKKQLIENQKSVIETLNQNLEIKVEERTAELTVANQELMRKNREIEEALFRGQTIERKRVATELHDNLGSTISGVKWRLEAMGSQNMSDKERKVYEGILEMMNNAYTDVRLLSHNLLPLDLEKKGFLNALNKLLSDLNESGKILFSLNYPEKFPNIDKKESFELYNICLEIINNILKHSKATTTEVNIKVLDENLTIVINDDGVGISNEIIERNGMGLKNIRDRIESLKGNLMIKSEENQGTLFMIKIPIHTVKSTKV